VSGEPVTFLGDAMACIIAGIAEATAVIEQPPVVVGGLAVLARLSHPYRATIDLDVVDRLRGRVPQLEILRAARGAEAVEPSAVLLPTRFGPVKIDVLEVRQIELDQPSDDPGDRLHALAHAWANDTATELAIEVLLSDHTNVCVTTLVAEPGPLIAMKLQAVMNRSSAKQGTDLLDIVRLMTDGQTRPTALAQIAAVADVVAEDMKLHVDLWFVERRRQSLAWIRNTGTDDVMTDDLEFVAELLTEALQRQTRN
jgi:hypothetical protein